jgi:hypothetical protein
MTELDQLTRELEDLERAHRRAEALRERIRAYEAERATIATERGDKQREFGRVRRGVLGAWLWARGHRKSRLELLHRAVTRLEHRRSLKERLLLETNVELDKAEADLASRQPLDTLRARFQEQTAKLREQLARTSPELAASLTAQEEELCGASLERESAELALRRVREIARLLEAARVAMKAALGRGTVDDLLSDGPLRSGPKYVSVSAAHRHLAAADQLMRELKALDPVRDDLEPLGPDIGKPLSIADYFLNDLLVDNDSTESIENALEGVLEAQKLFADLERPIAQKAHVSRTHAENLERRFRHALLAACNGS